MGYVDNTARNRAAVAIAKACKLETRVGTIELFLEMLEGLTDGQVQAILNANLPSLTNPFATLADIGLSLAVPAVPNYSALPDPTTVTGSFYFAEDSEGTWWLPGALGGTYHNAGLYYSNGVVWKDSDVPFQATQAEVDGGIVTDKFVTPETLANCVQLNQSIWTTDLMTMQTVDLYAPYAIKITTINQVVGAPSITILVDGNPYTLNTTIAIGSLINITSDIPSVFNLQVVKQ